MTQIPTEFEIKIDKIVPNGYGLGFAHGCAVFVSLAAKGDFAKVRVREQKGKTIFAEIIEIIEPSAERVAPVCRYFGSCGGCDFQQMSYAAQLKAKSEIISDSLSRIGKFSDFGEVDVAASPNPLGYRTRTEWHLDTIRSRIGYFRRFSHDVVDIEECPVMAGPLAEKLKEIRSSIEWHQFASDRPSIEAACGSSGISVFSDEIFEPTDEISVEVDGFKLSFDAGTFFQANPLLIEDLVSCAIGTASGATAIDLYSGVGLFSLPLTRRFQNVLAVEGNPRSVAFAEINRVSAQADNLKIDESDVASWLEDNREVEGVDFLLLDPPRTGCQKSSLELITRIAPRHISYVSCDPSTLARDLRVLCDKGYRLVTVMGFDLFPQTHHVETVARLERVS